jgi:hypothetical protein
MATSEFKEIKFYDSHRPSLQSGAYHVVVNHLVNFEMNPFNKKISFKVEGPQFAIEEQQVYSVYPPANSNGDFHTDLPSITFNRSTLPWERSPIKENETHASWLCLLVVFESEKTSVKENLKQKIEDSSIIGLTKDQEIDYLCVDQSFQSILPSFDDLNLLSFCKIEEIDIDDKVEKAVIIANRLPKKGEKNTVYLVSVEHRYDKNGFIAEGRDFILPFLYKWEFFVEDDMNYKYPNEDTIYINTESFDNYLVTKKINKDEFPVYRKKCAIGNASFHGLLKDLSGSCKCFSYPASEKVPEVFKPYLSQGFVAAKHITDDKQTISWYRGPLQARDFKVNNSKDFENLLPDFKPHSAKSDCKLPQQSEQLFLYDTTTNMCDVTYSSAWELGKLLALNDKGFNVPFFQWKQKNAIIKHHKLDQAIENGLAVSTTEYCSDLPQNVVTKFNSWKKLYGIPLQYLIPNIKMVPNESIRYFKVDKYWINSMLSGAFSVGHTINVDLSEYLTGTGNKNTSPVFMTNDVSGFILHSRVVSGWPDFEVDASTKDALQNESKLNLLRRELIAPNMLLFLFDGIFSTLKFHLHPGKTHFGFVYVDGKYRKNGVEVEFKEPEKNVVDIQKLYGKEILRTNNDQFINPGTAAQFAAAMLESIPNVIFKIIKTN